MNQRMSDRIQPGRQWTGGTAVDVGGIVAAGLLSLVTFGCGSGLCNLLRATTASRTGRGR